MHLYCNGGCSPGAPAAPARWEKRLQACGSSVRTVLALALLVASTLAVAADKLLALAVTVNGAPGGTWALLERDGRLYAPLDAFTEWRLLTEHAGASIEARGRTWRNLATITGYAAKFNLAEQSVTLTFAASEFAPVSVGRAYQPAQLGPVLPAAWVNYDFAYQSIRGDRSLGALTELGWSSPAGVLTSSAVARGLDAHAQWTRLESAFRMDAPARNLTVIAGDSTTRAGMWGRSLYFGGIQIGRNFALSPGLATYPRPLLAGQSAAPSTLELYVDDVLRRTEHLPSGPFSIDALPTLTGTGQVRVVVRDQLGRETVLSDDFHATASLLEAGLADFSVQAGRLRENLGIASADYGAAFGSGLLRYGVSDRSTLELRGEYSRSRRSAGMGLGFALPWHMVGELSAAVSDDVLAGRGERAVLELQRPTLRHGFSIRHEIASQAWRELGAPAIVPKSISSARYTSRGGAWNWGLAAARIVRLEGELTTASANATVRLGRSASLTLTATRISGLVRADAIGLTLVLPLGADIVSAGVSDRAGSTDAYVSASRSPGVGLGLGATATMGTFGGRDYGEASVFYEGAHARGSGQVHVGADNPSARLGVQGAVVASDSTVFFTPALRGSFAVIEAGEPGVAVQLHGSTRGRTGADGKALVSGLQPYRANRLRLDPNDLPIAAELDTIEHEAVPRARSGVKVAFPIRPGRAALLVVSLPDGAPAPFGATLSVAGQEFYVGARGRVFVTGIEPGAIARVAWEGGSCAVALELPAGEVPTVPVACR